jgi:hypothetical protein
MIHNVYFWLKPDLTPEQTRHFRDGADAPASEIDYLEHGFAGKPADTEKRRSPTTRSATR